MRTFKSTTIEIIIIVMILQQFCNNFREMWWAFLNMMMWQRQFCLCNSSVKHEAPHFLTDAMIVLLKTCQSSTGHKWLISRYLSNNYHMHKQYLKTLMKLCSLYLETSEVCKRSGNNKSLFSSSDLRESYILEENTNEIWNEITIKFAFFYMPS